MRATGAEVQDARPLVRALQQLGMPLYQCQPPTGYKDTADAWVNTGALVNRMNFALAAGRQQAARRSAVADRRAGTTGASPSERSRASGSIIETVLNDDVSDTTRATIAKATTPAQMLALTLGSPEFQRR